MVVWFLNAGVPDYVVTLEIALGWVGFFACVAFQEMDRSAFCEGNFRPKVHLISGEQGGAPRRLIAILEDETGP